MRKDTYVYIGVMVLMLVIIGNALTMVYLSSKLLPLIISGIVFVLAAIQLSREFLARNKPKATVTEETMGGGGEETWQGYSMVSVYIIGFFVTIYLLNFIIAIPMFTLVYMKKHGTRWRVTIISAAVITVLIYVVFELALNLNLYQGLLFKALGY